MTTTNPDDALQRVLDESEIRNLVGRIAHLSDDGELEPDYLALFTDDGSWGVIDNDDFRYRGHAEILAAAKERRAAGRQGKGTGLLHLNTSLWVSVDGPDTAHAESYFIVISTKTEAGPAIMGGGRYIDTFRRTDEGWKFLDRTVNMDVT